MVASNYLLWETQVLSLIESQDLLGFITGKTPEPKPTGDGDSVVPHPDLAAWTRTYRLVKAWITATISEEALGTVVGLTTSAEVWKALSNTYSQDSEAREFELLLKLQQKKKESVSLDEHIRDFKFTRFEIPSFNSRGRGFTPASSQSSNNMNHSTARNPHPNSPASIHYQICKKRGHEALKCWHRFDNSYQDSHVPEALATLHITPPDDGSWHPDFAATAHIIDNPVKFPFNDSTIGSIDPIASVELQDWISQHGLPSSTEPSILLSLDKNRARLFNQEVVVSNNTLHCSITCLTSRRLMLAPCKLQGSEC
ncbi:hypothetical protein POM88_043806 [Heracleum sosnowskyi]|uniref:Uncharacterized protein n=1 Tax=Heracleum sosnowskyi TaxID=360622 RepID=A0AAD8H1N8_9APIA|nr:hypothetical protein POM88_043806 [Heracleum sosnowskyi]